MKKSLLKNISKSIKVLSTALALTQGLGSLQAYADGLPTLDLGHIELGRDIDLGRVRLPLPDLRCAIDPAAYKIDFQVVRTTSTYRGLVRITGVVKNLGRESFLSRSGQQAIYLYEDSRIVARREFTSLASGASTTVVFQRNWDASSPAEGEFPPTYKVVVSYDPDIFIDGNPKNDDCTQRNNQLVRSGQGLNELF